MLELLMVAAALGLAALGLLAWRMPRAGVPLLLLAVAAGVWSLWLEPRRLTVARYSVPVEGLAAPVRVVAIGDIQPTTVHWPMPRIRRMIERAAREEPDLVLWLGDYAYDGGLYLRSGLDVFVEPAEIVAAMAGLTAPMGAWAVLGNHDWMWDGPEVARLIGQTDIRLLIDEAGLAVHPDTDARLRIVGLDDISTPSRTPRPGRLAPAPDDPPTLILSHSPDAFPLLPEGFALALAGHTHCGQVTLPGLGPLIVPIEHTRFACGMVEERDHRFLVTAGLGTAILPMRFMTPPEIMVIELTPG